MSAATELWAAVVESYESQGLISLTNIRDPSKLVLDTDAGEDAAQGVINLWPAYAQEAYDSTNALHVEVAKRGVIAMLWSRGGTSATVAKIQWDEVFSADGMISKVRGTGARARKGPSTNSGLSQRSELTSSGRRKRPWADVSSLPLNIMPRDVIAED